MLLLDHSENRLKQAVELFKLLLDLVALTPVKAACAMRAMADALCGDARWKIGVDIEMRICSDDRPGEGYQSGFLSLPTSDSQTPHAL